MSQTLRNPPTAAKPTPDFVPKWMLKPERVFDPNRALTGAIKSGNVELVTQLIEHYGLTVDREASLKQARLNKDLIAAVDRRDVAQVQALLDQGASPRAAEWNWPAKKWFYAYASACVVACSPCYTHEESVKAVAIARIMRQKGAYLAFCDSGSDQEDRLFYP